MGVSMGCCPSLSGMRPSSTLMATRSGVTSNRPPACPTWSTTSGSCSTMASWTTSADRPNTTGICTLMISAPEIVSGRWRTASHDGLMGSPPNGSKPVTKIFMRRASIFPGSERPEVHQDDLDDEQDCCQWCLRLDDAVGVLHLEQADRQGVEVGRHRGDQGAAEAGRHGDRPDDDRVASERDHERDTDAGGDDGERGECVADDYGEQRHTYAVGDDSGQLVALRHDLGDAIGDDLADA